jgi:UPF0716 protein FxsA
MAWLVVLGIIALPVVEIALFVKSAELIGTLPTVAVAVLLGMGGLALLRRQGLATALKVRAQLDHGELPVAEAFDGLCLSAAGFLLVLPGLLTDAMGLALLLPPVRHALRRWLARRLRLVSTRSPRPRPGQSPGTIEADYTVIDHQDPPLPPPGSGQQ